MLSEHFIFNTNCYYSKHQQIMKIWIYHTEVQDKR